MRSILISVLTLAGSCGTGFATPLDDSTILFALTAEKAQLVANSINAPRAKAIGDDLEVNVFATVRSAVRDWESAMTTYRSDTGYNHYLDYMPCKIAADQLTYLTSEQIRFHRGVDIDSSRRFRHADGFKASLENCAALISERPD